MEARQSLTEICPDEVASRYNDALTSSLLLLCGEKMGQRNVADVDGQRRDGWKARLEGQLENVAVEDERRRWNLEAAPGWDGNVRGWSINKSWQD